MVNERPTKIRSLWGYYLIRQGRYLMYASRVVAEQIRPLTRDNSLAYSTYSACIDGVLPLDHDDPDYSSRPSKHLFRGRVDPQNSNTATSSICNSHALAKLVQMTWLDDQTNNSKQCCRRYGIPVLLPTKPEIRFF